MSNPPLSILITDDDKRNRIILSDFLNILLTDKVIVEAENGEMAIAVVKNKIQTSQQSFDLIFMDYKMPGIDGEETTNQIREIEHNIDSTFKSIIITWSSAKHAPFPQADDWLVKPAAQHQIKSLLIAHGFMVKEN